MTTMLDARDVSHINYYFNNTLHRHVENFDGTKDLFSRFTKIMAKMIEIDKFPREIINELESLKRKHSCGLACNIALVVCHQKANIIDKSAIEALNREIAQLEENSPFSSFFCASFFHLHFDKNLSNALIYINKCLHVDNSSSLAHSLKGWILQNTHEAKKSFEKALKLEPTLCDAIIGLSKILQTEGNSQEAFNLFNEFLLTHSGDYPIASEQFIQCYVSLGMWEDAIDLADKVIRNVDRFSIPARLAKLVHHICTLPTSQVAAVIEDLSDSIDQSERGNSVLVARISSLTRRLACGNNSILFHLKQMLEKALHRNYQSQHCLLELANVSLSYGNYSEAQGLFERLSNSDDPEVYLGLIEAQIFLGKTDDCATQIQFLSEIHKDKPNVTSKILYLRAKLASDHTDRSLQFLMDSLALHLNQKFSLTSLRQLNPSFITSLISELYPFIYVESNKLNNDVGILNLCKKSLTTVNQLIPANSLTSCYLARLSIIEDNLEEARDILVRAGNINPNHLETNLHLSDIELKDGHVSAAETILETAVAQSFDVRQHHHYSRTMAQIYCLRKNHFEALKYARVALAQLSKDKQNWLEKTITLEVLVRVLISAGQEAECEKIIGEAENTCGVFLPVFRILGAEAAVSFHKDTSKGLVLLSQVGPSDPFYLRAVSTTADIYLKFKNNKKLYIACYRKLFEDFPSPATSMLYGDAFMEISEPENAQMIYKQGIKDYPQNSKLCLKLGELLTSSHQYGKSISYYEAALRLSPNNNIRLKLIKVLKGIKLYDKCIRIIDSSIAEMNKISNDLKTSFESIKLMIAKSEIFEEVEETEQAIDLMTETRSAQNEILKKVERQQPDLLPREQKVSADLIMRLGNLYWQKSEFERALSIFSQAKTLNDPTALLKLASAQRMTGDHGSAREICLEVTKKYPTLKFEAQKISIQIDVDCGLYDSAVKGLADLVSQKGEGEVLIFLVEVLRLSGRLDEADGFLKRFEGAVSPTVIFFCQALCQKFRGQVDEALLMFNRSRAEKMIEPRALFHMIDICYQNHGESSADSKPWRQRCSTARQLLVNFRAEKYPCPEQIVAETFCVIYEDNSRAILEGKIKSLQGDSSVVASYLLGILYSKVGQESKAKSVLKKLINSPWNFENREWLERSLLFLGSLLINLPNDAVLLAQKCLNKNKSSIQAYELLARAKRKLGRIEEEVEAYEMAWKSSCFSDKSIGVKLAMSYLKSKKTVKAIQICHKVNLPEQCLPILQRAWEMLRN